MDQQRSVENYFIRNYHFITLVKKTLFAFILVFMEKSPEGQLAVICLIHSAWFFLLLYLRPFSNRVISGIKIVAEAVITAFFISLFVSHMNFVEMKDKNFITKADSDYFWKIGTILQVFLVLFNVIHGVRFIFYSGKLLTLVCS
jgi:hypothetical protein